MNESSNKGKISKINEICADLQYNWENHGVGCLTHNILIGSQVN